MAFFVNQPQNETKPPVKEVGFFYEFVIIQWNFRDTLFYISPAGTRVSNRVGGAYAIYGRAFRISGGVEIENQN
jgi:hypothetical protein